MCFTHYIKGHRGIRVWNRVLPNAVNVYYSGQEWTRYTCFMQMYVFINKNKNKNNDKVCQETLKGTEFTIKIC